MGLGWLRTEAGQQPIGLRMRWQDDEDFCSWLLAMRYAEERDGKMFPFMALGMILYMHEAWVKGKEREREMLARTNQPGI